MFYLLSKVYTHEQICVIEADSFEEAKEKAKRENSWYDCEECLDYEGYRANEDEEDVYGSDYIQLDDIEF